MVSLENPQEPNQFYIGYFFNFFFSFCWILIRFNILNFFNRFCLSEISFVCPKNLYSGKVLADIKRSLYCNKLLNLIFKFKFEKLEKNAFQLTD